MTMISISITTTKLTRHYVIKHKLVEKVRISTQVRIFELTRMMTIAVIFSEMFMAENFLYQGVYQISKYHFRLEVFMK